MPLSLERTRLALPLVTALVAALAAGLAACAERAGPAAAVEILSPSDGATATGPDVRIDLAASGVEIAPATEHRPGTAHHHLFVDRGISPPDDTIPSGVSGILHLGRGQTEFTLRDVEPGEHTVIAVLADWNHIPLDPLATDTVRFTVSP